jgi:hypothetical protein
MYYLSLLASFATGCCLLLQIPFLRFHFNRFLSYCKLAVDTALESLAVDAALDSLACWL